MGDGKERWIGRFLVLGAVLIVLTLLTGCQNTGLGGITGNVVQEANTVPPTPDPGSPTVELKPQCADSDGGDEPSLAGTVTVVKEGSVIVSNDVCTSEAELIEQYCAGKLEQQRGYTCKYGCREGRCLASAREQITTNAPPTIASDPTPSAAYVPPSITQSPPLPPLYAEQKENVEQQITQTQETKESEYQEQRAAGQNENYNCYNGFRDTFETDTDCGGACVQKCAYGKTCQDGNDCAPPLRCNTRIRKCMQRAY